MVSRRCEVQEVGFCYLTAGYFREATSGQG
jgi:hypothetical protein